MTRTVASGIRVGRVETRAAPEGGGRNIGKLIHTSSEQRIYHVMMHAFIADMERQDIR